MKDKLTPWFPPSVPPVRPGVYETRWVAEARRPQFAQYQHWNGTFWGGWSIEKDSAFCSQHGPSSRQEPEWRGLAKGPK